MNRMTCRISTRARRWLTLAVGWLMLLPLAAGCGAADDGGGTDADGSIVITDARSRMSPRMAGVAAAYLTIENRTDADDALVAASVSPEIAGTVEVHETFEHGGTGSDGHAAGGSHGQMDRRASGSEASPRHGDGAPMMGMREIDAIEIPAGATVELVPGGLHIMLMALVDDLMPGDTFELTLSFEQAGDLTVIVEVREHA